MLRWCHGLHVVLLVASWSIAFGASATSAAATSAAAAAAQGSYQRALIIHGANAVRGRYPYFVALDHYGGGALIAPDIVLTAGHCKPHRRNQIQPAVGTYSFDPDADDREEFDIVKMVRHPGFVNVQEDDYILDFTILKLSGQSSNPLVKINRNHQIPSDGQAVVAMGMGDTVPDRESRAHILQQTTLNAIPNDACAEAVDPDRDFLSYQGRIFPSMMCTTGGPDNERDACAYDSGSPIIIPRSDDAGQDLLVALVSWGELCADPQFPGVNARVSDVSDWIDAVVCELSDNPPAEFCPPPDVVVVVIVPPREWSNALTGKGVVAGMLLALFLALCILLVTRTLRGKEEKDVSTGSPEQESLRKSPSDSYHSVEGVEVM